MKNVRRVNVLQTTEDLVQEVADVVVTQLLSLQQLVKVGLHQALNNVPVTTACKGQSPSNTEQCICHNSL